MLKILSLDLGIKTGWAAVDRNKKINSGIQEFKTTRFESIGMRYLKFKRWLSDINQSIEGIDIVYFESVRRHVGTDAAHAYGAFMGQLMVWCESHGIQYQGVPVGTIKKSATGKGNAAKHEMITAARELGHDPFDDNEADAICLLYYVMKLDEAA